MSKTFQFNPKSLSGKGSIEIDVSSEFASGPERARHFLVPLFIPREQAYYWTSEWQQGEAEAEEELRRGESRVFDDPQEALRWLDATED